MKQCEKKNDKAIEVKPDKLPTQHMTQDIHNDQENDKVINNQENSTSENDLIKKT